MRRTVQPIDETQPLRPLTEPDQHPDAMAADPFSETFFLKDFTMTASRILSIAALAAFASFGAQASELYGSEIEANFQSTRDRAEVQAEAAQAVAHFKNFEVADNQTAAPSTVSRAAVRADAVTAARAGAIATGNRS